LGVLELRLGELSPPKSPRGDGTAPTVEHELSCPSVRRPFYFLPGQKYVSDIAFC